MSVGSVLAEVVAVEARRASAADPTAADAVPRGGRTANVVSLTQRRLMDPLAVIAGLPPDRRPPSVAAYDELLKRRTAKTRLGTRTKEHTPHEHDDLRDPTAAPPASDDRRSRRSRDRQRPAPAAAADHARGSRRCHHGRGEGQLSYVGFLAELLLAEVDDRDRRSTIRRVASAGFPRPKFLDDIDYDANGHLNAATINTLAKATGFAAETRSASSATPAPARATCSSASAPPLRRKGFASDTRSRHGS
jgi:hypothetical protein